MSAGNEKLDRRPLLHCELCGHNAEAEVMRVTFPVYITVKDAPSVEAARERLEGMLRSEHILKISWSISQPIFDPRRPSAPTSASLEKEEPDAAQR